MTAKYVPALDDAQGYLPAPKPPAPLRVLRVLLYVVAVLTTLSLLAYLLVSPLSGASVGMAVYGMLPGVAAFVLAGRLDSPSRRTYWALVVLGVVYVFLSLAALGQGDPRGLTNLILPTAIFVLLTRSSSRAFLLRGAGPR